MEIQIERFKYGRPALYIRPSSPWPEDISTPTTYITMDNSVGAQLQAEVKFFPPLHEQRRSWALEILRREKVTSVGRRDRVRVS